MGVNVLRRYLYILTVFGTEKNQIATYSGTINWEGSRNDAFMERFNEACKTLNTDVNKTYVVHWSFELDELS